MSPLRIELVGSINDVRDEWTTLAASSSNVFATWEWASIWWRHYGRGRPIGIAVFTRSNGTVAGLLPMYRFASRPAPVGRIIGHGPADQLGTICAPEDVGDVMASVPRSADLARYAIVLLERLPGDVDWHGSLGGRVLAREASPALTLQGGSWDSLLAGWSSNRRGQARRLERRLTERFDHRYVVTSEAGTLDADLDTLFELHRARWGSQSAFAKDEAFHRDFARIAFEHGWLRLRRMEIGGRAVAAWYGLRFGSVESYYQAGRDPAFEEHAVGRALLLHSIRSALETGATEYRFLRGDEAFKARYATHDHGIITLGLGRGWAGRGMVAAADQLRRSPVRRLLRRRVDA